MTVWPNKSPEPTAVGRFSSAFAVHVVSRRWLSFFRWAADTHQHITTHEKKPHSSSRCHRRFTRWRHYLRGRLCLAAGFISSQSDCCDAVAIDAYRPFVTASITALGQQQRHLQSMDNHLVLLDGIWTFTRPFGQFWLQAAF